MSDWRFLILFHNSLCGF